MTGMEKSDPGLYVLWMFVATMKGIHEAHTARWFSPNMTDFLLEIEIGVRECFTLEALHRESKSASLKPDSYDLLVARVSPLYRLLASPVAPLPSSPASLTQ